MRDSEIRELRARKIRLEGLKRRTKNPFKKALAALRLALVSGQLDRAIKLRASLFKV